jgi:hypothetical protein
MVDVAADRPATPRPSVVPPVVGIVCAILGWVLLATGLWFFFLMLLAPDQNLAVPLVTAGLGLLSEVAAVVLGAVGLLRGGRRAPSIVAIALPVLVLVAFSLVILLFLVG